MPALDAGPYSGPSSTSATKAGQWRGCGTRVPARKREQTASDRPVAFAVAFNEKPSSFGVTSRRNKARSCEVPWSRAYSRLRRWCSVFAPPRFTPGARGASQLFEGLIAFAMWRSGSGEMSERPTLRAIAASEACLRLRLASTLVRGSGPWTPSAPGTDKLGQERPAPFRPYGRGIADYTLSRKASARYARPQSGSVSRCGCVLFPPTRGERRLPQCKLKTETALRYTKLFVPLAFLLSVGLASCSGGFSSVLFQRAPPPAHS